MMLKTFCIKSRNTRVPHNDQSGFSLIEISIGVLVLSFLTLSSGVIMVQAKKIEGSSRARQSMDREHLDAVHQSRSVRFIGQQMGLLNADGSVRDPNLQACLGGRGTNCQAFEVVDRRLNIDTQNKFTNAGDTSGTMKFNSTLNWGMRCPTAQLCEGVSISVRTEPFGVGQQETPRQPTGETSYGGQQGIVSFGSSDAKKMKPREFSTFISPMSFASRQAVSFSDNNCNGNRVVSGINFNNLQATCGAVSAVCPDRGPLNTTLATRAAADCQRKVAINCPARGVASVGLFQGQGNCAP